MSFDPEMFGQAMGEAIRKAVAPLHAEIEVLKRELSALEGLRNGVDGKDGASFTLEDAKPIIDKAVELICDEAEEAIQKAVDAIPRPKDGKDGADGKDGQHGRDGQDGKSFTLEDAEQLLDAKMARWELDFERRAHVALEKAIDRIPTPKDGKNGTDGKDGKDGIGFDDMDVVYDGERTVTLKFQRGETVKEYAFSLPVQIDRGVFKAASEYKRGDGVTWDGSYWIAQKDAPIGKPGEPGSNGWRLAVKKGRDGKDGRNGIDKTAPVRLEGKQ